MSEPCIKENILERIQNDIKELFTRVTELEKASGRTEVKLDTVIETLNKLVVKVDIVFNEPRKRWNNAMTVITTAILSGAVGFIMSKLL